MDVKNLIVLCGEPEFGIDFDGDVVYRMLRNTIFAQDHQAPIESTEEQGIYQDHAEDPITNRMNYNLEHRRGAKSEFPVILHRLLHNMEELDMEHIASWQPHGRAFAVHDLDAFERQVIPRFYKQSRFSSFQRQLNKYGFNRLVHPGPDQGAYYHEYFLRGREDLCVKVVRGQKAEHWNNRLHHKCWARMEPNFSSMRPVGLSKKSLQTPHENK